VVGLDQISARDSVGEKPHLIVLCFGTGTGEEEEDDDDDGTICIELIAM
jgi:hypothetical protein